MAGENKDNGDGKKNGKDPDGGNSEFENFQGLLKQVLSVSKGKMDKQRAEHERERQQGKRAG